MYIGDGAEDVAVRRCVFRRLGGNAIVLSNRARGVTIEGNEFCFLGESAIVSVGQASKGDGTAQTYPRGNAVVANHVHDIGLWTKQTAGYTQFLSCKNTVARNVMYNTPRAAINLNDNFGGGNIIEQNLLFNTVRETNDHGPLNMWSRMPYVTVEGPSGTPSTEPSWNQVRHNMHVCGFFLNHGFAPFDYDDGADHLNTTDNVFVYAGVRTCWKSMEQRYRRNVIVRPDLLRVGGKSSGVVGGACVSCPAGAPSRGWRKNESFVGNACATASGALYDFGEAWTDGCDPADLNATAVWASDNTYYGAAWAYCESKATRYSLPQWQGLWAARGLPGGGEQRSRVEPMPPVDGIVGIAASRLRWD